MCNLSILVRLHSTHCSRPRNGFPRRVVAQANFTSLSLGQAVVKEKAGKGDVRGPGGVLLGAKRRERVEVGGAKCHSVDHHTIQADGGNDRRQNRKRSQESSVLGRQERIKHRVH